MITVPRVLYPYHLKKKSSWTGLTENSLRAAVYPIARYVLSAMRPSKATAILILKLITEDKSESVYQNFFFSFAMLLQAPGSPVLAGLQHAASCD